MNINTCRILRDDLSEMYLRIEDDSDRADKAVCYVLYNEGRKIGKICFRPDDIDEWAYFGELLSYQEQGQVAVHIKNQFS